MVAELDKRGSIKTDRVRAAFLAVPREHFVPDIAERDGLDAVYSVDQALVTKTDKAGSAISSASAPSIMAPMLEQLDLAEGMRVLEIGAGTGYNAALMSHIVGGRGRVTTIDVDPDLVRRARGAIRAEEYPARVATADGYAGFPTAAPFDRIIATASFDEVPRPWVAQLREGGLIELPLQVLDPVSLQLIPALRKIGTHLASTSVVCGGFMGARRNAADPGPTGPRIGMWEQLGAGSGSGASLSGVGVGALSAVARRRALATLTGKARRTAVNGAPDPWSMPVALACSGHPRCVTYASNDCFGLGIVHQTGTSLAVVARRLPDRLELLTWGGPEASRQLERILDEWRAFGSPGLDRLAVTVRYGSGTRAGGVWRQLRSNGSTIDLDWRPA
jgi:protein-L-isoaspartate(D-aspartate) O-methyltransferase